MCGYWGGLGCLTYVGFYWSSWLSQCTVVEVFGAKYNSSNIFIQCSTSLAAMLPAVGCWLEQFVRQGELFLQLEFDFNVIFHLKRHEKRGLTLVNFGHVEFLLCSIFVLAYRMCSSVNIDSITAYQWWKAAWLRILVLFDYDSSSNIVGE